MSSRAASRDVSYLCAFAKFSTPSASFSTYREALRRRSYASWPNRSRAARRSTSIGWLRPCSSARRTSTTAIADGIAIPHARLDTGDRVLCGFGRSSKGLDFQSVDGNPTQIFFVLVSPESHPSAHLRWLAHLAMMLKNPDFRRALIEAKTPEDVLSVIENEEKAIEKREASSEAT